MIRPEHIALIRMVMSATEKFFECLRRQVAAGSLAIADNDVELAAAHFLKLCQR